MESLKATLTLAPILVAPEWGEPLLYIVANNHVVSTVLVIEREELGHP